jgi:hypothetical protein
MPFIVATYVYASSQGHRTHSARTNSRTMYNTRPALYVFRENKFVFFVRTEQCVHMYSSPSRNTNFSKSDLARSDSGPQLHSNRVFK